MHSPCTLLPSLLDTRASQLSTAMRCDTVHHPKLSALDRVRPLLLLLLLLAGVLLIVLLLLLRLLGA